MENDRFCPDNPPRFGFRDGWLYFYRDRALYRLKAWPRVIVEHRQANGGWRAPDLILRDTVLREFECFHLDPLDPLYSSAHGFLWEHGTGQACMPWEGVWSVERGCTFGYLHWQRFLATLPTALVKHASSLPCGFLSALELFLEVPAAMDLAPRNALLLAALARHWEFPAVGRLDWDAVRARVCGRRRNMLPWLGYQAREATVKGLERIRLEGWVSTARIQGVLAGLSDPEWATVLACCPPVEEVVMDCLLNPLTRQWMEPGRLQKTGGRISVVVTELFGPINSLLEDGIIDLSGARELSRHRPHECTMELILPLLKQHELPPAPVPLSAGIEPLETVQALVDEGKAMRNYAGGLPYFAKVAGGHRALYRITSPVRATLALHRIHGGYWMLDDIKGPYDKEVPQKIVNHIVRSFPFAVPPGAMARSGLG